MRDTWDYVTSQNVTAEFLAGTGGNIGFGSRTCLRNDPMEPNLSKCHIGLVEIGRYDYRLIYAIVHELAHVYTLANGITSAPVRWGLLISSSMI